jgi:hypothetical protein
MKIHLINLIIIPCCIITSYAGENPHPDYKLPSPVAGKAIACSPSTASADLDIGNVRARILVGGDMWWDLSNPKYEVPKNSGKHSLFAGALWIGGTDGGGQVRVAAQTYRQTGNDFWPGPVDTTNASTLPPICNFYDRFWEVTRAEVIDFVQNGSTTPDILSWPGNGDMNLNQSVFLAPFFDMNGNSIYEPSMGDYPFFDLTGANPGCCNILQGDQTLWWAFNDVGNIHTETGSTPIGIEVYAQAFAYNSGIQHIDNATFYQYKIINRSPNTFNNCFTGVWVDPDLGNALDDYVGCDVGRGLGYCYNGDQDDNGVEGYGLYPPIIGVDMLHGPLADINDGIDNNRNGITDEPGEDIIMSTFVYYNNVNGTPTGNPNGFGDFYEYLQSIWLDGIHMTYGEDGRNTSNPVCNFMFPDNTDSSLAASNGSWTEITAGNQPDDRRFLESAGPFTFLPGEVNCITIGVPWARDSAGTMPPSIISLRAADDLIQMLYDNCFVATGIPSFSSNPFQAIISPVPVVDLMTVSFNNKNNSIFTLTIYDIHGKLIKRETISGSVVTINCNNWENGVYLVQLLNDKGDAWAQKVVVE